MDVSLLRKITLLLVLVILFLGIMIANFSPNNEKLNRQITTTNNEDIGINIHENKLIDNFPSSVPIYPDSKVIRSYKTDSDNLTIYSVELKSDTEVGSITSWYIDKLTQKGWVFENKPEDLESVEQFLQAKKGDGKLYITIEYGEGRKNSEIIIEYFPEIFD